MKKILLAATFGLAFASTSFAQNGSNYWARLDQSHPETTIESIVGSEAGTIAAGGYRLSLTYNGQFRKLSPENMQLMQASGFKNRELKHFKYELLFKSNNQEFWLPVQTDLIEQLEIELREDGPVLLYTTVLKKDDGQNQKTLLVEDFKVDTRANRP